MMEIEDALLDKLLDRVEEGAVKRGAAEFELARRREFEATVHLDAVANAKDIGELKRLYDSTREELQVCRKDAELTLSMLRALYDAAAKTPNKTHSFRFSLKEALRNAKKRLDEAPF